MLDVYRVTDTFPKGEIFGISVQVQRAAISVPTRIAEGCGRDAEVDFAAQLQKARGTCSELEYLLLLCRDLGFLTEDRHKQLSDDVVTVRKMLSGLLKSGLSRK